MARFSDLLDRKAEDIERPPLLPIGIYSARITKPHSISEIKGKADPSKLYERLEFPCAIADAIEVDEEDLEAFGTVTNTPLQGINWLLDTDEEEINKREMTLFRIKTFLVGCGAMNDEDELGTGLANAVGCEFAVEIAHRPDPTNPDNTYLDVKKTMSLDEVE